MGRLAGPQGRVYAFEPQRKAYRELRRNIELNELANVSALRYAVGADIRIVEMNPPSVRHRKEARPCGAARRYEPDCLLRPTIVRGQALHELKRWRQALGA